MKKVIALFVVSIENSKPLKYYRSLQKHYFYLLFAVSVNESEKIFEEGESIEILKIFGLIKNI